MKDELLNIQMIEMRVELTPPNLMKVTSITNLKKIPSIKRDKFTPVGLFITGKEPTLKKIFKELKKYIKELK